MMGAELDRPPLPSPEQLCQGGQRSQPPSLGLDPVSLADRSPGSTCRPAPGRTGPACFKLGLFPRTVRMVAPNAMEEAPFEPAGTVRA